MNGFQHSHQSCLKDEDEKILHLRFALHLPLNIVVNTSGDGNHVLISKPLKNCSAIAFTDL